MIGQAIAREVARRGAGAAIGWRDAGETVLAHIVARPGASRALTREETT